MRSEIFVSFFIAISLIQTSVGEDPPSPPAPANAAQSNNPAKPQSVLPVVADNLWYYGSHITNYAKSFIVGDEWSLKYIIYKLLEGTHLIATTIADASDSLRNSPYITINSGPASPSDTTVNKEGETKKPEAETPSSG